MIFGADTLHGHNLGVGLAVARMVALADDAPLVHNYRTYGRIGQVLASASLREIDTSLHKTFIADVHGEEVCSTKFGVMMLKS